MTFLMITAGITLLILCGVSLEKGRYFMMTVQAASGAYFLIAALGSLVNR